MSKRCPSCGAERMEVRKDTYRFEPPANITGGTMVVQDATWEECENCGEQLLSPELDRKLDDLRLLRLGLLPPGRIKAVREKLGLTQTVMAERLGVGEKTYARWESGRSIQNKSSDNLIRLMDRSPEQFAIIEAQRSPERNIKISNYFKQIGQQQGENSLAMAAHDATLDEAAAKRVREALRKAAKEQRSE
jgi:putative zinc finger/helix-turn-helix YgiT family protein